MFLKDKTEDMGVNFNVSFVGNSKDGYTAGAHVTASDGTDVSAEVEGTSPNEITNTLILQLMKGLLEGGSEADKKAKEQEEAARKEKQIKLDSLYNQVDKLEEEIARIEHELHDTSFESSMPVEDSHLSLDNLFGTDKDDFFDYLDSLLK